MGCISDYRKFTFSLCEQLSQNNLDSMKFLLRDLLSEREIGRIGKPEDLFVSLEQRNELGDDNFRLLEDLLTQIKRQDLVRKLNRFEREQLAKGLGNYDTATEDSRSLNNTTQREHGCPTDGMEKEEITRADRLTRAFPWKLDSRALIIRKHMQDCNTDGKESEEKAVTEALDDSNSELSRKCTDQWKPDSRTLNSQEHPQGSKRDATEKEEENVIESSMSSELSELSLRSEDDAGDISLDQLEQKHEEVFDWVCLKLDNGRRWFRRDYERLAAKYKKITPEQRMTLHDEIQNERSPSKLLMSLLQTKYRCLPLSQFVKTLKEIRRKDIAQKLMPYVTHNTSH